MPDYKPNQIIRVFAVLALICALILVVIVIATTGGSSDGSDKNGNAQKTHITKAGQRALHRGAWIVHAGDTLGAISLKTGVDQDTIIQLNPELDPQVLREGERIALR